MRAPDGRHRVPDSRLASYIDASPRRVSVSNLRLRETLLQSGGADHVGGNGPSNCIDKVEGESDITVGRSLRQFGLFKNLR